MYSIASLTFFSIFCLSFSNLTSFLSFCLPFFLSFFHLLSSSSLYFFCLSSLSFSAFIILSFFHLLSSSSLPFLFLSFSVYLAFPFLPVFIILSFSSFCHTLSSSPSSIPPSNPSPSSLNTLLQFLSYRRKSQQNTKPPQYL